jgi:hypothetical protein
MRRELFEQARIGGGTGLSDANGHHDDAGVVTRLVREEAPARFWRREPRSLRGMVARSADACTSIRGVCRSRCRRARNRRRRQALPRPTRSRRAMCRAALCRRLGRARVRRDALGPRWWRVDSDVVVDSEEPVGRPALRAVCTPAHGEKTAVSDQRDRERRDQAIGYRRAGPRYCRPLHCTRR